MSRPTFPRRGGALVFAAVFGLCLSGCSEGGEETLSGVRAQEIQEARPAALAADDWLDVDESVPPAVFFAHAVGGEPAAYGPPLEAISAHYRESPRMVVNRLLQLWRAAREGTPDLTPDRLIADFTPGPRDDAGESLGPVAQHYLVLRGQGLDHRKAVAAAMSGEGRP